MGALATRPSSADTIPMTALERIEPPATERRALMDNSCIFCMIASRHNSVQSRIIYEDEQVRKKRWRRQC